MNESLNNPQFSSWQSAHALRIEEELSRLIPLTGGRYERLAEAMRYSVLGGGKRLRALIIDAGCTLFDLDPSLSLRAGCAIEMMHAYSLIHDDLPCMDDATTRRGRPACHLQFDEATAVLAGDALQALSFEILAREDWPLGDKQKLRLGRALSQAAGRDGMCGGQMLDLLAEKTDFDAETIVLMQALKTGALFEFSAQAGALMADADGQYMQVLHHYARNLGLAFQIKDDLLDLTGDQALMGKDLRRDDDAHKATLPGLLGTEKCKDLLKELAQEARDHLRSLGPGAFKLEQIFLFSIDRSC